MKLTEIRLRALALIFFLTWSITGCVEGDKDIIDGDWVEINGVKWSTCNVGAPGTFVANPEDYGEYYQWNKGTTDFLLSNDYWNSVYSKSDSWLPANDPSPTGYRVPTSAEIQSLLNITYVTNEWTTLNGVAGSKFTDKATGNSIFMPAAGFRESYEGTLYDVGKNGRYWSSTLSDIDIYASYYLFLDIHGVVWNYSLSFSYGFKVRPVAK